MEITLIRHGKTPGNIERRYVGNTDDPLAKEGIEAIQQLCAQGFYPCVEKVYCSPLTRCVQTSNLIYPNMTPEIVDGLREYNFGDFEMKTHEELLDNADYKRFLESGGYFEFPAGDSFEGFVSRTTSAFEYILDNASGLSNIAIVCHGGSIMSIMHYLHPSGSFYDWQVSNGCGYIISSESKNMKLVQELK